MNKILFEMVTLFFHTSPLMTRPLINNSTHGLYSYWYCRRCLNFWKFFEILQISSCMQQETPHQTITSAEWWPRWILGITFTASLEVFVVLLIKNCFKSEHFFIWKEYTFMAVNRVPVKCRLHLLSLIFC